MEDMIESDLFTQIGHPDQLKIFIMNRIMI